MKMTDRNLMKLRINQVLDMVIEHKNADICIPDSQLQDIALRTIMSIIEEK